MSLKVGDLVTIKDNEIQVQQFFNDPLGALVEPLKLKVRKGLIFEVMEVWTEYNVARILPVNINVTEDYVILAELNKLHKCGRAVEFLYGPKKR
jgi:hypothetical protein